MTGWQVRPASLLVLLVAGLVAGVPPCRARCDEGGPEVAPQPPTPDELRELLQLAGAPASAWRDLPTTEAPDEAELANVARIVDALRRVPWEKRCTWAAPAEHITDPPPAGSLVSLRGTALSLRRFACPAQIAQHLGISHLYRVHVAFAGESDRSQVAFAASVPVSWPEGSLNEPCSAIALAVTAGPGPNDAAMTLLLAPRIGWHPDVPLGRLGMDVGLLDDLRDRTALRGQERECFYQTLAAVRGIGTRWSPPPTPAPNSVVPLFNDPAGQRGDWIVLEGTARRITRILVEKEVANLLRLPQYWEVDLVTSDSQGNPLVFCALDLPPGMPTGENIYEPVRCEGFFLKSWAFRPGKGSGEDLQLAPLLVGLSIERIPPGVPELEFVHSAVLYALLGAAVAMMGAGLWHARRRARPLRLPDSLGQFPPTPSRDDEGPPG